ncbi:MAG: hypothetical protein HZA88_23865 [Verrucomicrobia bacterium]|nr:hypothetical protein [Verrucomicrobiota bacterium]
MPLKRVRSSYWLEVVVVAGVSVATFLLSARFDLVEAIVRFSREHEGWEIDEILTVSVVLMILLAIYAVKRWRELIAANRIIKQKNDDLQNAFQEIKQLKGIIPICANCKKIRDDKGYWHQVEVYIGEHTAAEFSHGLCPDCVKKLHPGIAERYHTLSG